MSFDERAFRLDYVRDLIQAASKYCGIDAARERAEGRGVLGDHDYRRRADGGYLGSAGNLMGDILANCRASESDDQLSRAVSYYVGAYVDEAIDIRRREIATRAAVTEAVNPVANWPESDDEQRQAEQLMRIELVEVALTALASATCAEGRSWKDCTVDDLRVIYHGR